MNLYLRCLSAAVFLIAVIATIDGTLASELEQWGVVTKNKAAAPPAAPDSADEQPAPVTGHQETGAPAPEDHAAKQSTERPAATPRVETKTPLGLMSPQENKKEPGNSSSAKKNGTPKTALHWESLQQKETCEKYLSQMREHFLKTRHYSIQGASCATAESAAAFEAISEKCVQQCPAEMLAQGGYTNRILRNIDYLERLGKERCGPAAPPTTPVQHENPQMPQRAAESSANLLIKH
jgi:hypothetical protein